MDRTVRVVDRVGKVKVRRVKVEDGSQGDGWKNQSDGKKGKSDGWNSQSDGKKAESDGWNSQSNGWKPGRRMEEPE